MLSYNIFLIGFMGTGKSTVADYLNRTFGMHVIEMDQLIEEREEMSISDIFSVKGEEYFRNLETNLLIELQGTENTVVSCGGGAVLRKQNVGEMKKNGCIVLLTASPEIILDRVKDNHDRPLLNGNINKEFIEKMMEQRREKYEEAADVIVSTDNKTIDGICEELIEKLKDRQERLENYV